MGVTRSTKLRMVAGGLAAVLLICSKLLPASPTFVLLVALLSATLFATSASNSKGMLSAAIVAVAGSILCHAFPETATHTGLRLRQHAVWLLPSASLVFACSGGATLPPVPAETPLGRLWQALKTPVTVMVIATLAATAAGLPSSPATSLAMALCYFSACYSTKPHSTLHPLFVFLYLLTFMSPNSMRVTAIEPSTAFAVTLAGFGLAQVCIGMKRTGSEPSSHP